MLNKVMLIGHLGQAPELKRTKGGQRYAILSLATSEYWRDKQTGERKKQTDWHRIVVWNEHLLELVEKYCTKGSKLWIEGKLSQRSWTDDSGKKLHITEIVLKGFSGVIKFMDSRKSDRVPDPDSEDGYGDISEMERVMA